MIQVLENVLKTSLPPLFSHVQEQNIYMDYRQNTK